MKPDRDKKDRKDNKNENNRDYDPDMLYSDDEDEELAIFLEDD